MFAKLGDYLDEHNIQRPTRYVSASGEKFVVLPAKEYSLLTGIDVEALPIMEMFDTVSNIAEAEEEKQNSAGISSMGETGSASILATIPLEEEFNIDRLPL